MIPFGDALKTLIFDKQRIDFVGLASIGVFGQSGISPGGCEYRAVYGTALPPSDGGILFPVLLVYQYSRKSF